MVAIIILTYNQKEKTLRCLQSCRNISGVDYKIFLWDNGSEDDTWESINKKFPQVIAYYSENNIGVAAGRNTCAKKALKFDPEFLLFLDNDVIVEDNFLCLLTRDLIESGYAIASPKIKFIGNPKYLYGAGGLDVVFKKGKSQHIGYHEIDEGQYDLLDFPIPSGGCLLVRTEVFNELNGFDEVFSPYGPEDIDFAFRASRRKYKTLFVPQAVIYHEPVPSKTAQISFKYAFRRIYHWLIILKRHGTLSDLFLFTFIYGPFYSAKYFLTKLQKN